MKQPDYRLRTSSRLSIAAMVILALGGLIRPSAAQEVSGAARDSSTVVEVVASGFHFEAPDQIASGWTTIRFRNETGMTHFVILEKMPVVNGEQLDLADSKALVVPVFQNLMDSTANRPLSFPEKGLALPGWFGGVVFLGGPGLVGPYRTAETTVLLEPGTYIIECYVKTGGLFHSANGMIDQIVVTDEVSRVRKPRPTLRLTLSSTEGIEVEGTPSPGTHTIAVHFADQMVYSNMLGHDVHLARIEDDTSVEELAAWMNPSQPGQFETPAPARFLGGVQDMPAGSTAYFTVLLEPGNYAFIAEVPDPEEKKMLKTFTVPAAAGTGP